MEAEINNDALIHQLGGCGQFQTVLVILASLPILSATYARIFMSFGLVNPGWRCLDNNNNTTNANNSNSHNGGINTTIIDVIRQGELFNQTMTTFRDVSDNYTESCVGFNTMSCQHIEFSPESSTIVTEWGLVCDKAWIPSIIITSQTVGALIGGIIGGYLGDKYGRKRIIYTNNLIHGILNLLCVTSTTWQMFTVFYFFIGGTTAVTFGLAFVYVVEFVSPKWRAVIAAMPIWATGCLIFVFASYVFKNWRYLHIFIGLFTLLSIFPALVLPESLRWLIVNEKSERSLKVVEKVARMNKVSAPNETCLALIQNRRKRHHSKATNLSFLNLFRNRLWLYALILGLGYFSCDALYFGTSFGLSALPGDFYLNSVIVFVSELPGNVIAWFAPNLLGRRPTAFLANIFTSVFLLALALIVRFGSSSIQEHWILALVILARTTASTSWFTVVICENELFPVMARSKMSAWRTFMTSLGVVLSPHIFPSDGLYLYKSFLVLAVFPLVFAFLVILLPETKGRAMEDDFNVDT